MNVQLMEKLANKIRQLVIISILHAGSGHPAGALGMADIFTYLYFNHIQTFPEDPSKEERDRMYVSNGHICPVWYAALAIKGFIPIKDLTELRDVNSYLEGHPVRGVIPGVENTSGSLGQGLSQAIGCAIGLKNKKNKIICTLGDGELNEGQIWESFMFLGNSNLTNLVTVIDRNNIQLSEFTENIMPVEPLVQKLEAFNMATIEIDAHNFEEIDEAFKKVKVLSKPAVIIANTIPGKGVSFMENNFEWHGRAPTKEEAKEAINELKSDI